MSKKELLTTFSIAAIMVVILTNAYFPLIEGLKCYEAQGVKYVKYLKKNTCPSGGGEALACITATVKITDVLLKETTYANKSTCLVKDDDEEVFKLFTGNTASQCVKQEDIDSVNQMKKIPPSGPLDIKDREHRKYCMCNDADWCNGPPEETPDHTCLHTNDRTCPGDEEIALACFRYKFLPDALSTDVKHTRGCLVKGNDIHEELFARFKGQECLTKRADLDFANEDNSKIRVLGM